MAAVFRVVADQPDADEPDGTETDGTEPDRTETHGAEPGLTELDDDVRQLLLALAVGFDATETAPPIAHEGAVAATIAKAQRAGLVRPDATIVPRVRRAILEATPGYQVRQLQRALVDAEDGVPLETARAFALSGYQDERIARELEAAADAALDADPALAAELYEEAEAAGMPLRETAARHAQASFAAGQLDRAGRLVDMVLTEAHPPDLGRATQVAGALWARRGLLARSADTYRWAIRAGVRDAAPHGVLALLGIGDREGADALAESAEHLGAPTLFGEALALMVEGMRRSLGTHPEQALPDLVLASDMMTACGSTVPLVETPAVLAALAALHGGEPGTAQTVIDDALEGGQAGFSARPRLLLFRALVAMRMDRPALAHDALAEAQAGIHRLSPRDELLRWALVAGIARRSDDSPGLLAAWQHAHASLLHVTVDLFDIIALEELVVAGARVRESHRLADELAGAWRILEGLGSPPLWSVHLHWSAIQAAILTERPDDLAPHAEALVRDSAFYQPAALLAGAGRAWVSVLGGEYSATRVEAAARSLASIGLTWDGSRLAGHAAARSEDRKDMARLLACARELHPGRAESSRSTAPVPTPAPHASTEAGILRTAAYPGGGTTLGPRERDVALLVVEGNTHREIGEALFLSPRTVEHHIAHLRQRLGAGSRSELIAALRPMLLAPSEELG